MEKILAVIPARGGSNRIPNKNTRIFNGKPLIYYAIKDAKESNIFDRIIVDTDSPEIAKIAQKYGAEVPFLRPADLATSGSKIVDAIDFLLKRLKAEYKYVPDIVTMLQTTSPLREVEDIQICHKLMSNPKVKSLCTICEASPWFHYLDLDNKLILVNKDNGKSTNTQEVKKGYVFNGCMVYMIRTGVFLKTKKFVDKDTVGAIIPKWRSVDLDYPEDWVLAEFLHKNKNKIYERLKKF